METTACLSDRHSHSAGLSVSTEAVSHGPCADHVLSLTCVYYVPLLPEWGLRCPLQAKHSPITSNCGNASHLSGFSSNTTPSIRFGKILLGSLISSLTTFLCTLPIYLYIYIFIYIFLPIHVSLSCKPQRRYIMSIHLSVIFSALHVQILKKYLLN